jgi:hypothetical protein
MQRGKIYLSIGEEAIVEHLMALYGIKELEAVDHVIKQKRELAFIHFQRGNDKLAKQIMSEIGE